MKVYKYDQSDKEAAKSKRGRAARRKGHDFEREIVNRIKSVLPEGYGVRRMLQGKGGAGFPDVEITNDMGALCHIECKKGKRPNIPRAYDQAFHDHKPGTMPVVVSRADRSFTLVTLRWTDFTEMLTAWLKDLDNLEE